MVYPPRPKPKSVSGKGAIPMPKQSGKSPSRRQSRQQAARKNRRTK